MLIEDLIQLKILLIFYHVIHSIFQTEAVELMVLMEDVRYHQSVQVTH